VYLRIKSQAEFQSVHYVYLYITALFIYYLFNDAVNSSDYRATASNDEIIVNN
jgi:hypothetical protein